MATQREEDLREISLDLPSQIRDVQFTFVENLTDPKTLLSPSDKAYRAQMVRVPRTERSTTFSSSATEKSTQKPMPEVTKELLDARLEAIEARMDARVSGMSAKLDATLAEIRADRIRFTQLETDIRDVKSNIAAALTNVDTKIRDVTTGIATASTNVDTKLAAAAAHTDAQIAGLKSNIWFGVATTIGALIAALGVAFASFDSGRETSKNISEATAKMEKISAQLEAAAKLQAAKEQPPDVPPKGASK